MQKTLGWIMLLAGVFILFVGYAFPMVTVVVDTTPPAVRLIHPSTATGSSLTELVACVIDPESGIKSVICEVADTTHSLFCVRRDPLSKDEKWYLDITDITTPGDYPYSWTITNKAGLSTILGGTYTIYTDLQGKWYVNDIEITSPAQTVYAPSKTVSFKFVKTAGVADSSITCTVWEGTTQLLTLTNSAMSTWTGSYTFTLGKHTLDLKASDGTQTVTMSVIGLQVGPEGFQLPQFSMLQILSLASIAIGTLLVFTGKKH